MGGSIIGHFLLLLLLFFLLIVSCFAFESECQLEKMSMFCTVCETANATCVPMCKGAEERAGHLKQGLQQVVSCSVWVLGPELGSCAIAAASGLNLDHLSLCLLTHEYTWLLFLFAWLLVFGTDLSDPHRHFNSVPTLLVSLPLWGLDGESPTGSPSWPLVIWGGV